MQLSQLKPLQKHALAALYACEQAQRCRGGFAPEGNPESRLLISVRTAKALHRGGLITFSPPDFPAVIALSGQGLIIAEQLSDALDLIDERAAS